MHLRANARSLHEFDGPPAAGSGEGSAAYGRTGEVACREVQGEDGRGALGGESPAEGSSLRGGCMGFSCC